METKNHRIELEKRPSAIGGDYFVPFYFHCFEIGPRLFRLPVSGIDATELIVHGLSLNEVQRKEPKHGRARHA